MTLGLGIDIGTSGVRTAVIDMDGSLLSTARLAFSGGVGSEAADANNWWRAVRDCLLMQVEKLRYQGIDPARIRNAAIDGTSGSMVLVGADLEPVAPALMYDGRGFVAEAQHIANHAEPGSITRGDGSALARLLRLQAMDGERRAQHLLHQADFVLARLAGRVAGSDDNNTLKLGFDPERRAWPAWLGSAGIRCELLPEVHEPGTPVARIDPSIADSLGLSRELTLHAGTTDSIAAFLATGAGRVGDAVTSLGTTLVVKLLSETRVDDAARGIYSHRLRGQWLAGGASNTGGGVLAAHFSPSAIEHLTAMIDSTTPSGLDYYPLPGRGERFPVNDPELVPRLTPRPVEDHLFLQGIFEGIARIEAAAYTTIASLGSAYPKRIFTAGGGARNQVWTEIRRNNLSAPLVSATQSEAAVGAARLALNLF